MLMVRLGLARSILRREAASHPPGSLAKEVMGKSTFAQSGVNGEPSQRMEPAASDGSDEYKERMVYSPEPPPKSTFWVAGYWQRTLFGQDSTHTPF